MKFYVHDEGLVAQAESAQDNAYLESVFGLSGAVETVPVVIHSAGRRTAKRRETGNSLSEHYVLRIESGVSTLGPVTAESLSNRIAITRALLGALEAEYAKQSEPAPS